MKEINGFPGYFVTEDGKVYSNKSGELRELKQYIDSQGKYKNVFLMDMNGQRKVKTVHRLVAETFIPNSDNLPQVNHIDENKLNNHADNLEWVTAQQNARHSGHKQAKFYIIENKNRERFEVFNLTKWCRENNCTSGNLTGTYSGRRTWHKGYRVVKVLEV